MTQIDTLKASRPRHIFPLAAITKTKGKTIQTHAFSRQISSQTPSLLAILVEVPDVKKNSQGAHLYTTAFDNNFSKSSARSKFKSNFALSA